MKEQPEALRLADAIDYPDVAFGIEAAAEPTACTPDCADHDEDCAPPHDYVACWTYAPERGMCPYLRAERAAIKAVEENT